MAKITFIEPDNTERIIDCATGQSVMEGAVAANVEGILAECGGACACATCHIVIEADPNSVLPEKSFQEAAMLEGALNVTEHSRLACQIEVVDALEGVRVRVPESQF